MKNKEYWRKRSELLENALLTKGDAYIADLDKEFKKAMAQAEKDLVIWYQRLADNNGISLQQAKRLLTDSELQEFKWTVEDYIKHGKENALNQHWMKELENASARMHISRLEAIKLQLQQQAEALYGNHLDNTDALLRDIYTDGYYRTAFELQRGIDVGWTIAALDNNRIGKVLSKPWAADGINFSSRVWRDRTRLVNELHTELTQMIIRGEAPDRAIKAIAKRFGVSNMRAGTLVMTESAYFASASQRDCYKDLGVDRYEIVETLDNITCGICQDLDGRVFPMSEFEAGVTAPPFHPRCRGTTCPYFDDEFTEGEQRTSRGKDGKTYNVPADMHYKEWRSYNEAIDREPAITETLQAIAAGNGVRLEGFDFRTKTPESFMRKVRGDMDEKHIDSSTAIKRIYDTVRYTSILPSESFAENYASVVESLKQKGYTVLRVKNTLCDPAAVYRGVNAVIDDPSGFKFEMQFHTEGSFATKQKMHGLYEQARTVGTSKAEQERLAIEMKRISESIKMPNGIERIESFNRMK